MITCIPARYVRFSIDYSERKGCLQLGRFALNAR
jgi:hypothetical protein